MNQFQLHAAAVLGSAENGEVIREGRRRAVKEEVSDAAMRLVIWMDNHMTTRPR